MYVYPEKDVLMRMYVVSSVYVYADIVIHANSTSVESRQEDQEYKVILSYITSKMITSAVCLPNHKEQQGDDLKDKCRL